MLVPILQDVRLSEAGESPYPLRQWLEALHLFDRWLDTRGLSLPIENQISYVSYSAEADRPSGQKCLLLLL